MAIEISEKAVEELIALDVGKEKFLRVEVVSGGCSGMTFNAAIDDTMADDDEVVLQQDDLRVVANSGSLTFLDGLQIDFSDDLVQSGFRFKNPKAAKSCGCGASFQV